jgi:hypothetical protein
MKYSACILRFPNFTVFAQKRPIMSKMFNIFIMLLTLLASACASQTTAENNLAESASGGTVLAEKEDGGDDPDAMICRREQVTGTNFRRRVCMTRGEREQRRADTQEEILEHRSSERNL